MRHVPVQTNDISSGAPEGCVKQTATSSSSSPLATELIPAMTASEAALISAINAFRGMAAKGFCCVEQQGKSGALKGSWQGDRQFSG